MICPHCEVEVGTALGKHMADNCPEARQHSEKRGVSSRKATPSCDDVYEALPDMFCIKTAAESFRASYNTVKKRIWELEEEGRVERLQSDLWQRNPKG